MLERERVEMLPGTLYADVDVAPVAAWRAARGMKASSTHAWPATVRTAASRS
jgi:hypothetical protein